MKRLAGALAATALTGGLLGLAPQASAAPTCPDLSHMIVGFGAPDVAVGTKKVKTMNLEVFTDSSCDISQATAVLTGPRTTYRVKLHPAAPKKDTVAWTGKVRLDPKKLRNADAGTWKLRYEVSRDDAAQAVNDDVSVRRATRVSFNAGPEPVKNGKLTFSGKLERASWNSHRYAGVSKPLVVHAYDKAHQGEVDVLAFSSAKKGSYRQTVKFPGTNTYWVTFDGGTVSAPTESRKDRVAGS